MWPVIRHIGLIDTIISLCHIGFVSVGIHRGDGLYRGADHETSRGMHEKQYVFFLLEHFFLGFRLISAMIMFGASFQSEFRKQFNACIVWAFLALITVILLTFQLMICQLHLTKIITSILEVLFRITCGIFVLNYMRNEKQ